MPLPDWGSGEEYLGPRFHYRRHLILKALPKTSGWILDAACGLGGIIQKLMKKGFSSVIGLDRDWGACRVCRDKAIPVVLGDVNHLPFQSQAFQCIISSETLEHIPEDHQAVQEFYRLLQPQGYLVITVPAHQKQFSPWDTWAGHLRRYELKDITMLFSAFLPYQIKGFGFPFVFLYDRLFLRHFIPLRAKEKTKTVRFWLVMKKIFGWLLAFLFRGEFPSYRWNVGWLGVFIKPSAERLPATE